jgi:hypothetical protein
MLHIYIHLPSLLPNLDSVYTNIKKTQDNTISALTATSLVYISNIVYVAYLEDHEHLLSSKSVCSLWHTMRYTTNHEVGNTA